jgi:hypothetical protein
MSTQTQTSVLDDSGQRATGQSEAKVAPLVRGAQPLGARRPPSKALAHYGLAHHGRSLYGPGRLSTVGQLSAFERMTWQNARQQVTLLKAENGQDRPANCDARRERGADPPICEPSPRYLGGGIAGYIQD